MNPVPVMNGTKRDCLKIAGFLRISIKAPGCVSADVVGFGWCYLGQIIFGATEAR